MVLQKGSADGAVRPAGPAAAPVHVITLTLRVFLVSALRLRRTLKSRVLLSMLPHYPLRPWRLFGFFSAEFHGVTASNQQLAVNLCHQKSLIFHSWFKFLLLLCVVLISCFYIQSSSFLPWLDGFFNQTNQVYLPPPYRVHPKHSPKPNESYETTESPTVPPTGTLFHQAHPYNYHFIMDNKEVCKTKTPFLVLMVPVAPTNVAARNAIRQTWGNKSLVQGEVVLTLFMLGLSGGVAVEQLKEELKHENLQHHDLIQSDFMDTYLNLTIKTMVIMHWLATRCQTAPYAMKIDSDMFLNIDNLVMMLQKPGIPKLNYLTGMLMWNRPVVRSKNSKWYVSEEMYPDPQYPTYTLGMGYVFSNDLPEKFVEVSKSIKPFNIEDAYIGLCMKKLGLAPISPPDSSQFKAYNTRYDRCEYSKIITYILGSSQELVKYWTDLKKPEPPCNKTSLG